MKCGCHFAPTDFDDLTFEGLKKKLERGYISIDLVDGEMIYQRGFFYILRARNEGAPIVDFGYNRRSKCCLLTKKGCKLSFEERPSGGKSLIPGYKKTENNGFWMCTQTYEVEQCCYDWRPYHEVISKLVEYFKDKDFPCSIWISNIKGGTTGYAVVLFLWYIVYKLKNMWYDSSYKMFQGES